MNTNNTVRPVDSLNIVTVVTDETQVNVTRPVTNVVRVVGPGPIGPVGPQGIQGETGLTVTDLFVARGNDTWSTTGSLQISGSLIVSQSVTGLSGFTGSLQGTAATASYFAGYGNSAVLISQHATYNTFTGSIQTQVDGLSNATSSYVLNSITSSMLQPYVLTSVTQSMLRPYVLTSVTQSMLQPYVLTSVTSSMLQPYVLTSITASMLQPYVLTNVTSSMLQPYVLTSVTQSMLQPYVLTSVTQSMLQPYVLTSVTGSMLQPYVLTSTTSSMIVSGALTASYYLETDPIFVAKSGSLATTGSNRFVGNQIITGSVYLKSGSVIDSIGADIYIKAGVGTNAGVVLYNNNSTQYLAVDDTGSYANKFTVANKLTVSGLTTTQNQQITGSLSQGIEGNIATGVGSHAEGSITKAIGEYSHAEGDNTQAIGNYSHAEGQETITLASAQYSHAEGWRTIASANHQHVQGQWNATSSVQSAFIVGNGSDNINRSNLIHAAGNEIQISGSMIFGTGGITGSLRGTAATASFVTSSNVQGPYGMNSIVSASYALTSSYINTLTQDVTISGSLFISGSTIQTGNINLTGSLNVVGGITGSLFGTSSWATNAITASYVSSNFQYEIHVSQVDGNDTTGNGDLLKPVATIGKALSIVSASVASTDRRTIIVHPGTYTENITVDTTNTYFFSTGLLGANCLIAGSVTISAATRMSGLKMTNLIVSSSAPVYLNNCAVDNRMTVSGSGYLEVQNTSLQCTSGIQVVGPASSGVIFENCSLYPLTVNNASAAVYVISCNQAITPTLTAGALTITRSTISSLTSGATSTALTTAAGSVLVLESCNVYNSLLTSHAAITANGFYSIKNIIYNRSASTLASLSGTGGPLATVTQFQYINADNIVSTNGLTVTGSLNITGSTTQTGNVNVTGNYTQIGNTILSGSSIVTGSTILIGQSQITGSVNVSGSVVITGSLTANFAYLTGSLLGTAATASFVTSSNVQGPHGMNSVVSASYAVTASYVNTLKQYVTLTGSLNVSGSVYIPTLTNDGQLYVLTYNTASGQIYYTGSTSIGGVPQGNNGQIQYNNNQLLGGVPTLVYTDSLLKATGSFSGSFTGLLIGTAATASFVTSSNVQGPYGMNSVISASHAVTIRSYAQLIGDGATNNITVNHGLGTNDLHITVYSASGNFENIIPDIHRTDTNTIQVRFINPPGLNQYRVYISV